MPNHIQNRLKIVASPERVKEVFAAMSDEDGFIDFEKIIPSPQSIKDVGEIHYGIVDAVKNAFGAPLHSNDLIASLQAQNRAKNKLKPEDHDAFIKACVAYKETGFCYWYDWNIAHWGTKWNAYDQPDKRDTKDTRHFNTAWSCPVGIVNKIAELFPDVEMFWDYADENSGSNTGRIKIKNGDANADQPKNQSKGAYDIYFDLHPDRISDYELIDGKYQYKEEES